MNKKNQKYMKTYLNYDKNSKSIILSATSECYWYCSISSGNILLKKYYGMLKKSNQLSYSGTVYSYGISEMYGDIECRFDNGECQIVKKVTIDASDLFLFNVTNTKVFLFGTNTKSYIYLYYGYVNPEPTNNNISSNILINVSGNTTFEYNGTKKEIELSDYNVIFSHYNSINGCIAIEIISSNNLSFHDTIFLKCTIEGVERKIIIHVYQDVCSNKPTIFKISPSVIFLTSKSRKQKVSVISMKNGVTVPYEYSMPPTQTETNPNDGETMEQYLQGNLPSTINEVTTDIFTIDKNATNFTIEIADVETNENITGTTGYLRYIYPENDESQKQQLEIFFDYIADPNNYIKITKISNICGFYDGSGDPILMEVYDFPTPTNMVNLRYVKTEETISGEISTEEPCFFALSDKNVIFSIESKPSYFNIVHESPSLKEVIQGNELQLTIEKEIENPSEEGKIILQNKNGSTCYIYVSHADDIFEIPRSQFGFCENNDIKNVINVQVPDSIGTFENIQIISLSDKEEITLIDTIKTAQINESNKTFQCDVISYSINDEIETKTISAYTFNVKYNQNIGKYYITYGSLHEKYLPNNEKQIELHDTNNYYFEKINETNTFSITLPQPYNDRELPWGVKTNGNGIKFKTYHYNGSQFIELSDLSIISSGGTINNTSGNDDLPRHIFIGFINPPELNNSQELNGIRLRNGDICFVAQQKLEQTITESIILRQALTFNEITIYATINGSITNENNGLIFKIGTTSILENMEHVSSTDKTSYFELTEVDVNVPQNVYAKLYYASYKYENVFLQYLIDVNTKLRQFYDINKKEDIQLNQDNAIMYWSASAKTDYQGIFDDIKTKDDIEKSYKNKNQISSSWNIDFELGHINFTYWLNNKDNLYQINEQIPTSKKNIDNYIVLGFNDYDNGEISYGFILIVEENTNLLYNYEINALKDYEISFYKNQDGNIYNYVKFPHKYKTLENVLLVNGKKYAVIGDTYYYNGKYYEIYNDNNENYIIVDEVACDISWDGRYFIFSLPSQQGTVIELVNQYDNQTSGLTYTHSNSITYEANLYWETQSGGSNINILESVDGQENEMEEQDKYIVLHEKKYNTDIEGRTIVINTLDSYDININENDIIYTILPSHSVIPSFVNNLYQYIILDYEKYELIDNFVIYDNIKYEVEQNEQNLYVINNKGYSAYTQYDEIYTIINNQRCNVILPTGKGEPYTTFLYYEDFIKENGKIKYFPVNNIFNITLRYNISLNDLINNPLVKAYTDTNILLSNGYIELGNNYFVIQKEHNLDEITYNIITKEYVEIPFSSITSIQSYLSSTINFQDKSDILFVNDENKEELHKESGETLTVSSSSIITFYDYSKIIFDTDTWITYLTDNEDKYAHYTKLYARNESIELEPQSSIKINIGETIKLYSTNRIAKITVDNTDIYLKILLVNNQEAINYNDNIYYIYNNKVIINNQEFNCYDRCCIYNDGSENDTIVPIQYFNASNENTEIFNNVNYGYLNNEGNIQLIDINSATSISYKIVLPTYQSFSSKNGEIILWEYELTDILVYNNSNFSYSRATVQSYYSNKTLNKKENLIIENDKLEVVIKKYEVSINDTYYTTSEKEQYKFKYDGIEQSIWDWDDNKMLPAIPIGTSASAQTLTLKGEIVIDDIKIPSIQNAYVQIDDEFYPLLSEVKQTYLQYTGQTIYNMYCYDISSQSRITCNFNVIMQEQRKYFVITYAGSTKLEFKQEIFLCGEYSNTEDNNTEYFIYFNGKKYLSNNNSINTPEYTIKVSTEDSASPYIDYHPFVYKLNENSIQPIDYLNINTKEVKYYFYDENKEKALFQFNNYLNTSGLSTTQKNLFQNVQGGEVEYYIHENNNINEYIFTKKYIDVSAIKYGDNYDNIIVHTDSTYTDYKQITRDIKTTNNYLLFTSLLENVINGNVSYSKTSNTTNKIISNKTCTILHEKGLYDKNTDELIRFVLLSNGASCEWRNDAAQLPFNIRLGNVRLTTKQGYQESQIYFDEDTDIIISNTFNINYVKFIYQVNKKIINNEVTFTLSLSIKNYDTDENENVSISGTTIQDLVDDIAYHINNTSSYVFNNEFTINNQVYTFQNNDIYSTLENEIVETSTWRKEQEYHIDGKFLYESDDRNGATIDYYIKNQETIETKEFFDLNLSSENRGNIIFDLQSPTLFYVVKPYNEDEDYVHFYLCEPIFKEEIKLFSHWSDIWDDNSKYLIGSYETISDKIYLSNTEPNIYFYPYPKANKLGDNYFIIYKDNFQFKENIYKMYYLNEDINMVSIYDKAMNVYLSDNKEQCYIDLDTNASLSLDVDFSHNLFSQGNIKSFNIANLSELEQTIYVILTQKSDSNDKLRGQFKVTLE